MRHLLRPFAYLPVEEPELAGKIAADLDGQWTGAVAGTELGRLCYASDRYDGLWQTLSDKGLPLFIHPCPYRKSNPDVLVMQSSQERLGNDAANGLDRARNRCILAQR